MPHRASLLSIRVRGLVLVAGSLAVCSLGGLSARLPGNSVEAVASSQRRWLTGDWQLLGSLRSGQDDLLKPTGVAARGDTLYVMDAGDRRVKAFTIEGRPLWSFGAPGTFASAYDVKLDRSGRVWVAEEVSGRITILSSSGALVRTIQGPAPLHRFLPSELGFWGLDAPRSALPRAYDSTGRELGPLHVSRALAQAVATAGPLVAEPMLGGDGSAGVIAFRWSDRLLLLEPDGRSVREYRGIQPLEFPSTVSRTMTVAGRPLDVMGVQAGAPIVAVGAAMDSDNVYVLDWQVASDSGRTLDLYRRRSGAYVGSYRLPERAYGVAVQGRVFVGIVHAPQPGIRVWRWHPRPEPATPGPGASGE